MRSMEREKVILQAGEGESINLPGMPVTVKVRGEDTSKGLAILELTLAPRFLVAPPHTHKNEDEIVYLAEGELKVVVGDMIGDARPGSFILMPRGVPHTFWNSGKGNSRLHLIATPAGMDKYFEELAGLFPKDRAPDMGKIAGLAARFGIHMDFEGAMELISKHDLEPKEMLDGPALPRKPER